MKKSSFYRSGLFALLLAGGLLACDNSGANRNPDTTMDEPDDENTAVGNDQEDEEFDETGIYYTSAFGEIDADVSRYTYYPMEGPEIEVPAEAQPEANEADNSDATVGEKKVNQKPAQEIIYTYSELDRPPLFSEACKNQSDPAKCSNQEVINYVHDNVRYPERVENTGSGEVEFVTFVIDENGKIGPDVRVISEKKACPECAGAAVAAIRKMPDWEPAVRNGKAVKARITVPIRFEMPE